MRITYGVLRRGMLLRILESFSDPPNFSILLVSLLMVVVAVLCARAGGTEVEPSSVELCEAKTQRQPHSAERKE